MEESRKYEVRKLAATLSSLVVDGVFLVYFLKSGWTFRARDFALQFTRSPWLVVMIYVVIFGATLKILQLPFSIYSGYWLERQFRLSRQTLRLWLFDYLKGLVLSAALGLGAVEIGYYLLRTSPDRWWIFAASLFVVFVVLMIQLAPVLLLPLFYKFRPSENVELRRIVDRLARKTEASLCGVYEWSLGEKTRKANAAVVGWGKTRRIIVSDTLLQQFSLEEIETIMAHELCHHVKNHVWQQVALQVPLTYLGFFLSHVVLKWYSQTSGFNGIADVANLPMFLLSSMILSLIALPGLNYFSRRLETAADAYALDVTGDSLAFVSGMEKLANLNLANTSPNPIVEFIFYSHPSIEKRIRLAADRVNV